MSTLQFLFGVVRICNELISNQFVCKLVYCQIDYTFKLVSVYLYTCWRAGKARIQKKTTTVRIKTKKSKVLRSLFWRYHGNKLIISFNLVSLSALNSQRAARGGLFRQCYSDKKCYSDNLFLGLFFLWPQNNRVPQNQTFGFKFFFCQTKCQNSDKLSDRLWVLFRQLPSRPSISSLW